MKKALLIFSFLLIPLLSYAGDDLELLRKAAEMAKGVEGKKISEYRLLDQNGEEFLVSRYAGKPLLVSFIFTTCPDICSSLVSTLVPTIEELKGELGDEFEALVVGFDAEYDTPEMMREFGDHHETDYDLVTFGSGDAATIARMTKDFGFYFEASEEAGFNHLGLVTVVDAEGEIYRQVYKAKIGAADLRAPIKQLLSGETRESSPTLLAQIKGLCLKYDPETGEYSIDYAFIFGVVLQAVVVLICIWLAFSRNIKSGLARLFARKKLTE